MSRYNRRKAAASKLNVSEKAFFLNGLSAVPAACHSEATLSGVRVRAREEVSSAGLES
jgi:hypothetical protein